MLTKKGFTIKLWRKIYFTKVRSEPFCSNQNSNDLQMTMFIDYVLALHKLAKKNFFLFNAGRKEKVVCSLNTGGKILSRRMHIKPKATSWKFKVKVEIKSFAAAHWISIKIAAVTNTAASITRYKTIIVIIIFRVNKGFFLCWFICA